MRTRFRNRGAVRAAVVAGIVLGVAGSVVAGAAAAPAGGRIQIFTKAGDTAKSPIVVIGAIGDYGTAISMDKNGKLDANGNYVKLALKKGTLQVDATALNKAHGKQVQNLSTCSFAYTVSAPVKITSGAGLYAGATGTVEISLVFAGVGPVYASGAHKGKCNQKANPIGQWGSITGTGTVTFG